MFTIFTLTRNRFHMKLLFAITTILFTLTILIHCDFNYIALSSARSGTDGYEFDKFSPETGERSTIKKYPDYTSFGAIDDNECTIDGTNNLFYFTTFNLTGKIQSILRGVSVSTGEIQTQLSIDTYIKSVEVDPETGRLYGFSILNGTETAVEYIMKNQKVVPLVALDNSTVTQGGVSAFFAPKKILVQVLENTYACGHGPALVRVDVDSKSIVSCDPLTYLVNTMELNGDRLYATWFNDQLYLQQLVELDLTSGKLIKSILEFPLLKYPQVVGGSHLDSEKGEEGTYYVVMGDMNSNYVVAAVDISSGNYTVTPIIDYNPLCFEKL